MVEILFHWWICGMQPSLTFIVLHSNKRIDRNTRIFLKHFLFSISPFITVLVLAHGSNANNRLSSLVGSVGSFGTKTKTRLSLSSASFNWLTTRVGLTLDLRLWSAGIGGSDLSSTEERYKSVAKCLKRNSLLHVAAPPRYAMSLLWTEKIHHLNFVKTDDFTWISQSALEEVASVADGRFVIRKNTTSLFVLGSSSSVRKVCWSAWKSLTTSP
jgi:hypothetical protein